MTTINEVILKRIEMLEAELAALKQKVAPTAKHQGGASLRGVWKDANLTGEEIAETKRAWTKEANDQPG